jgi:hypothetical protein
MFSSLFRARRSNQSRRSSSRSTAGLRLEVLESRTALSSTFGNGLVAPATVTPSIATQVAVVSNAGDILPIADIGAAVVATLPVTVGAPEAIPSDVHTGATVGPAQLLNGGSVEAVPQTMGPTGTHVTTLPVTIGVPEAISSTVLTAATTGPAVPLNGPNVEAIPLTTGPTATGIKVQSLVTIGSPEFVPSITDPVPANVGTLVEVAVISLPGTT